MSKFYPDVESKVDTVDDYVDTEVLAIKTKTDTLPAAGVFVHQADAILSQANPVSTTEYDVLTTATNVRVISIAAQITGGTTQKIDVIVTIDGQTVNFIITGAPVGAGTWYGASTAESAAATAQVLSTIDTYAEKRAFLLEGRSVAITAAATWTVQPSPLEVRVKYAQIT